ncbi:triacylglycerol lipase [Synechococcus sp. PCC 7336]|uniref:esterase/lipase family protein n=1 Tax=Synechococcus sp. PCC 7336 TaxID=195250 RepID=UPI000347B288|nr:alpha/beta fold hydrolase [Synechococcus sp. PCC 7336]
MEVLLIHGLGRSPLSMLGLARHLQRSGYSTELFGYFAATESYDRIALRLRERIRSMARQGAYAIVAHSLGGLLTRSALTAEALPSPAHAVFLGTPHQSSRMAAMAWQWWPFRWFARDCGWKLARIDWRSSLSMPTFDYTIVAGTLGFNGLWSPFGDEPNDGIVAVGETSIGDRDRLIQVPVFHTFMMNHPLVQQTILEALDSAR